VRKRKAKMVQMDVTLGRKRDTYTNFI